MEKRWLFSSSPSFGRRLLSRRRSRGRVAPGLKTAAPRLIESPERARSRANADGTATRQNGGRRSLELGRSLARLVRSLRLIRRYPAASKRASSPRHLARPGQAVTTHHQ